MPEPNFLCAETKFFKCRNQIFYVPEPNFCVPEPNFLCAQTKFFMCLSQIFMCLNHFFYVPEPIFLCAWTKFFMCLSQIFMCLNPETWYKYSKKKVNCTLVQALRLCTGRTAHRGSWGIVLPFIDHGTRRGWGVSVTPRLLFTPWKDPVPIIQEAGWAPGMVWTGAENLAPHWD